MIVLTTADARAGWAKKIGDQWRNSVTSIIRVGELLRDAKKDLSAADFTAMIANDLPFGERAAQMLVAVGGSERLAKHASALPASWYSLYELQRLPEKTFEKAVKDGRIHPDMERKEVAALAELPAAKHASARIPERPEPREVEWAEAPATPDQPRRVEPEDRPAAHSEQIDSALGALDTLVAGLSLLDPKAVGAAKSEFKRDKIKKRIATARALLSDLERALAE